MEKAAEVSFLNKEVALKAESSAAVFCFQQESLNQMSQSGRFNLVFPAATCSQTCCLVNIPAAATRSPVN